MEIDGVASWSLPFRPLIKNYKKNDKRWFKFLESENDTSIVSSIMLKQFFAETAYTAY